MYRIFGHYVPKTMFIFGLFETLVLLISVHLALMVGLQWGYFDTSVSASYANLPLNTVFFICVMQAAMFAMGLYSRDLRDQPRRCELFSRKKIATLIPGSRTSTSAMRFASSTSRVKRMVNQIDRPKGTASPGLS